MTTKILSCLVLVLAISWPTPALTDDPRIEIHFIDVGQGDSTLVICPNGKTILVDAGSSSGRSFELVRDYLIQQLDKHSRRVDTLIITHPDIDHYNLLADVLEDIPIGKIFMTGKKKDFMQSFRPWLTKYQAITKVVASTYFDNKDHPNPSINCGQARVHILAASIKPTSTVKNTWSIVLKISYDKFDVILTGDATKDTESVILERFPQEWLESEVLKMGHHGSRVTSTGQPWSDAVKPKIAIASAGEKNQYGHPSKEVIDRLAVYTKDDSAAHSMISATGKKPHYQWHEVDNFTEAIYSTAASGNIVITSDGGQDPEIAEVPYPEQ